MYSTCPVTDGAAALLLVNMDSPKAKQFAKKPIRIAVWRARRIPTACITARSAAAQRGPHRGGEGVQDGWAQPSDISFAELHDAFVILELAISEELGFFERGKAYLSVRKGETRIDGKLPINTSGGFKSKGHPVVPRASPKWNWSGNCAARRRKGVK
jgi:acetyl-CoA C-acetyltransferase